MSQATETWVAEKHLLDDPLGFLPGLCLRCRLWCPEVAAVAEALVDACFQDEARSVRVRHHRCQLDTTAKAEFHAHEARTHLWPNPVALPARHTFGVCLQDTDSASNMLRAS